MILQHHQIWGSTSQEGVNTEIGGLGATITTKTALANLLQIPESNIGVFKIIGNDIHCQMKVNYVIPPNTFGNENSNISPAYPQITKFLDKGRKLTGIGQGAFANCTLFTEIESASINYIGRYAMYNTRIKRADFSYLPQNVQSTSFEHIFSYNPDLEYVNTGNLETALNGTVEINPANIFKNCTNLNLQVITKLQKYGGGMFESTNISEYINPYVIRLEAYSMRSAGFRKFDGQNVEYVGIDCFYRPVYRNFEEAIFPNATTIKTRALMGDKCRFTLIDIRSATTLEVGFLRLGGAQNGVVIPGGTMKIHQSQTSHPDILEIHNFGGRTIEIYDNNGNYIGNL